MKRSVVTALAFYFALAGQEKPAMAQDQLILNEQLDAVAPQAEHDTLAPPTIVQKSGSSDSRFRKRIDAGYRLPPVHPYFRDQYRIIQDMRRLLFFVNPNGVHGFESVPEMVEKAHKLPVSKQTEIIRVAFAGSIANFASEAVSRELRQSGLRFVQWELEKVVFRGAFRYLNINAFNGVRERGFGFIIPRLRLSFSRHTGGYYLSDSITLRFLKRLALNYTRFDGRPIFTPILATKLGSFVVSYDKDIEVVTSAYNLRRGQSVLVRLVHVNYLRIKKANYLRSEVMMQW